jgi:hypothetical protein
MGQNLTAPNTNATAAQVAALPTTTSLASQSNVAIKSIQRGVLSLPNNGNSTTFVYANATISPVVPAKTELRMCGEVHYTVNSVMTNAQIQLLNSVTVQASGGYNGNMTATVSWELTEYY